MEDYVYFMNFNTRGGKACPLDIPERLVYGYLAYRDRAGQGSLVSELQDALPLYKTVQPALDKLAEAGLVTTQDKTYRALPPGEEHRDWFIPSKYDNKHWTECYVSHKFYRTTKHCPWSPQCLAVFCLVLDFDRQQKLVTVGGLTSMLKISATTVQRAFRAIASSGIITLRKLDSRNYDVVKRAMPYQCEDWFVRTKKSTEKPTWLRALLTYRPNERALRRVTYIADKLRPYYPATKQGYNHANSSIVVGFDYQMNDVLAETLKLWDKANYESPIPLMESMLWQRWKELKKLERSDDGRYFMYRYKGEDTPDEDLDRLDESNLEPAWTRTDDEESIWR